MINGTSEISKTQLLYILTSIWVLLTPTAGQIMRFHAKKLKKGSRKNEAKFFKKQNF